MTEFLREIENRLETARRAIDAARLDGDDYLVQVHTGELESLERLAAEHRAESVSG